MPPLIGVGLPTLTRHLYFVSRWRIRRLEVPINERSTLRTGRQLDLAVSVNQRYG